MTSNALFYYSIGMVAIGLQAILSRGYYSMKDTKTPMVIGTIGMIINIILNIILSKYLGIGGLALATSIAAIVTSILMFISLRKKIGRFGIKQISTSFIKILFASLIMSLIAKTSFIYLKNNVFTQNISLVIAIIFGVIVYFAIIFFMRIEEVDVIVKAIKRKIKKWAA